MSPLPSIFDAIVVGGGPAGLSAALLLGRCRRAVAVIDEGHPRNEKSPRVNCFLGLPASSALELLETGRSQLADHPNVNFLTGRVEDVACQAPEFRVFLKGNAELRSRSLIIATGLIDRLPEIEGIRECYGKSVFTCPYCDGWENSDRCLGVMGSGDDAVGMAIELRLWSERVSLFVTGQMPGESARHRLEARGIEVHEVPVAGLSHDDGELAGVQLEDGSFIECSALFLVTPQFQDNDFMQRSGCRLTDDSQTESDESGATRVPGLYVAGNAKRGLQLAMVAAADGLKCAAAANEWLLNQEQPHPQAG